MKSNVNLSITAIVPTKNRPIDLAKAIHSICNQTRLPNELIVVDQSEDKLSMVAVQELLVDFQQIKLIYLHDPAIKGLVDAKRVSINYSSGDVICFLEDDVILEREYLEQIELGFIRNRKMMGCSGFITNQPNSNSVYKILFAIFHLGIFADPRMRLCTKYYGYDNPLIASNMISGGTSAWRRVVFDYTKFDVANGFHMYEDVDFSTRVAKYYIDALFINPNARLAHYFSPIGRDFLGVRQRRKLKECFLYYKKRKNWNWAKSSFVWLLVGLFLESIVQSLVKKSIDPVFGYFLGFIDGLRSEVATD